MKTSISDAVQLLRSVEGKKVSLTYHDDADGICSAALLVSLLHKLKVKEIKRDATRVGPTLDRDLIDEIVAWKPDLAVTVDFAGGLDGLAEAMCGIKADTLCIDHHIIHDYDFPKETVYINPRKDKKAKPASAYVFDLLKRFPEIEDDLEDLEWIAALGTIGDFGVEDAPGLIRRIVERYPELFETKEISSAVLRETTFGRMAEMISSASVWGNHLCVDEALDAVLGSAEPKDLAERNAPSAKKIGEGFDEIMVEAHRIEEDFEDKSEKHGKVRFFIYKSPYRIKAMLATRLGVKHSDELVMICQDGSEDVRCSFRCQDGSVDLDNTLREILKGLEGTGGGHPKAAGATIDRGDFPEFKKRLFKRCS